MSFGAIKDIIDLCEKNEKNFYQIILEDDCKERDVTKEASQEKMTQLLDAMLLAAFSYDAELLSASKMVGGDGGRMEEFRHEQKGYCGDFIQEVMAHALQMGESNACMKRIVAAPTAGSCGVLPAVLVPLFHRQLIDQQEMVEAMYVAAGIGQVIASRAFIAGAAGGCQAEIGSASAMAAGALVYLKHGSAKQIGDAVAIALKGLLGLACDPVAGLVEVPCVKRNVVGALNALSSADMVLAGIKSAIPVDEVIDAMKDIGIKMDVSLKETGKGGLAATPTGKKIKDDLV